MSQVATTGYIGVIVGPGDENLVAGGKLLRKRARKVEGERGHILTKDNSSAREAFKKSAIAAWAASKIPSDLLLVSNAPSWLALHSKK
jgi:hypothetical protein